MIGIIKVVFTILYIIAAVFHFAFGCVCLIPDTYSEHAKKYPNYSTLIGVEYGIIAVLFFVIVVLDVMGVYLIWN